MRLPVALVAAVVVAEVAVLLLRPRELGPEPVRVEARAYFTESQITRANDFRSGQRWLFLLRTGVEIGALVIIVRRAPRLLERRPVLAGAAAGAVLALVLGTVTLPVRAVARERAMDVGLITQSWGGWAGDVVKAELIGAGIGGAAGALLVFAMRRFGPRWWVPGTVVVVLFAVGTTYVGPILLDPVFNKFTPLPAGETRSAVLELADEAGVEVGEVYEVDASRRTTAANAYVAGIGSTKRVVLYDTLLEKFTPAEQRLVIAHELAHVRHRDVPNGLLYVAIVAPFGMFAVARLAARIGPDDPSRAVPAVALSLALVAPVITSVSNQLSRAVERRADAEAIALTGDPRIQVEFQRRITIQNVSEPEPPGWYHAVFGTHPTTLERIGLAEAAAR